MVVAVDHPCVGISMRVRWTYPVTSVSFHEEGLMAQVLALNWKIPDIQMGGMVLAAVQVVVPADNEAAVLIAEVADQMVVSTSRHVRHLLEVGFLVNCKEDSQAIFLDFDPGNVIHVRQPLCHGFFISPLENSDE